MLIYSNKGFVPQIMLHITTDAHTEPIAIERNHRIYDLMHIYPDLFPPHARGYEPVAALVNNELVSLSDRVYINAHLKLLYPDETIGADLYRRSLIFLLGMAWHEVCPNRSLTVSHSIGHAYYFYEYYGADVKYEASVSEQQTPIFYNNKAIDKDLVHLLGLKMNYLVEENLPILNKKPMSTENAVQILEKQCYPFAAALLRSKNENRVLLSQCRDYFYLSHLPLCPTTGYLGHFEVQEFDGFLILIYPSLQNPLEVPTFSHNRFTHALYEENHNWAHVTKIECIGALNQLNRDEKFKSYIQICESRQNQKMGDICKLIIYGRNRFSDGPVTLAQATRYMALTQENTIVVGTNATVYDEIKLIMISGPSSSGKTTFAMKLQYNLTVMGRNPLVLSMDNYFVNRAATPKDASGAYDFESIYALDIELFNYQLQYLLNGKTINMPIYDFHTGERAKQSRAVSLPYRGIVIIEGIHALNPIITKSVPMQQKFGIFIQPLTSISFDERTRTSTRDYRLIRRIVRDKKFRGFSAEQTIKLFENVRRGEEKWIFPNQARADVFFNTALDYELMVLTTFVTPLLHDVAVGSEAYTEARRILTFLGWVQGVNADFVPRHSILREFIGGSAFTYD